MKSKDKKNLPGTNCYRNPCTYKRASLAGMFLVVILLGACKKLVEAPAPATSVSSANVFNADATAIAAMDGVYSMIGSYNFGSYGINCLSFYGSLSADELTLSPLANSSIYTAYYTNSLNGTNTDGGNNFWIYIYPQMYQVNSVISGVSASNTLTPAVKKQLLGEAEFMRALLYFYLVNLYGEVPLVTGIDYKVNNALPRAPQAQVWTQIIADLKAAQDQLSSTYIDGTLLNASMDRFRPIKWAATALLARAYLYTNDYADATLQASAVINNSALYSLVPLNNAFLIDNNEAIWQLQPTAFNETNAPDGASFILPSAGPGGANPVYLSNGLVSAFEPGDQRKTNWTGSVTAQGITYYYPNKYKVLLLNAPPTEYETVFRLGEQYLIRAEAEANGAGGGSGAAVGDLNVIRTRAGLPAYAGATDQASLMTAILHERQVELFTEWGHRWLDLKRTKTIDAVMGSPGGACAAKGGVWNTDWALYPIPVSELKSAINLTQNPGY